MILTLFIRHKSLFALLVLLLSAVTVQAQTTAFTYQGRLNDGVAAANGSYDMEFRLFDAATNGTQIGSTITRSQAGGTAVTVTNGVFTVNLDYSPATPFSVGANRWLEIAVKRSSDPVATLYTVLTPRQQITSSPYSIRTLSATVADSLSNACVGCVNNSNIDFVAGSKVTGTVASATSATNAVNAQTATTAGNVTGTVALVNGGTGANSAANARTNLGLGTLATVSPSGTASATTFLRGDNSWQTLPASKAIGLTFNPTTQTAPFTINPADNYSVYQVNKCAAGTFNVTLPTAAAAGAGRVFHIVNIAPNPCTSSNLPLRLVLSGGNWIEYSGNTTITTDRLRYVVVSNGVDGWLLIQP